MFPCIDYLLSNDAPQFKGRGGVFESMTLSDGRDRDTATYLKKIQNYHKMKSQDVDGPD